MKPSSPAILIVEVSGTKPIKIDMASMLLAEQEVYKLARIMIEKAFAGETAKITLEIRESK